MGFGSERKRCAILLVLVMALVALLSLSSSSFSTFVYNETDVVRIFPDAIDPDGDNVTFVFSEPLNASGEWQTDYDDAGTYNVTIAAFDGKAYSEENVILVIQNTNRPPVADADDFTAVETETVAVELRASDPDGDNITTTFSPPLNESGEWQTGYNDSGVYTIPLTVSDGKLETTNIVTVTINDKNRIPAVQVATPESGEVTINETGQASFSVSGSDPDGDVLTYIWFLDSQETADGPGFTYVSDYESAGKREVRVEVSDGKDVSVQSWTVDVANVNRAPSVQHLEDVALKENELLRLELPDTDVDGDAISYTIDEPVGDDGQWQPSFDDAGTYPIRVVASDGSLSDTATIDVTVLDVDRAPDFKQIGTVLVNESDELRIALTAVDPDGDDVRFSAAGIPDAVFDGDDLVWRPDYDFVSLPNNIMARTLSRFRLDRFVYPPERTLTLGLSACGKELCSNQSVTVSVQNVNRPPTLDVLTDIFVNESEKIVLAPTASDPDGDVVKFYYGAPVGKNGRWATDFDDAGTYDVTVGATDGKVSVEKNVHVVVANVNRASEFGRLGDKKVSENETISFTVPVSDPDGDALALFVEDLPAGAEFRDGVFSWTPGYDAVTRSDGGEKDYSLTFGASDATNLTVEKTVIITVKNTNRAPVLTSLTPNQTSTALLRQPVVFAVQAFDPDGDELRYRVRFSLLDFVRGATSVRRTFTTPGVKKVELLVSDGKAETPYDWFVTVGRQVGVVPTQPVQQQAQPVTFVTVTAEG